MKVCRFLRAEGGRLGGRGEGDGVGEEEDVSSKLAAGKTEVEVERDDDVGRLKVCKVSSNKLGVATRRSRRSWVGMEKPVRAREERLVRFSRAREGKERERGVENCRWKVEEVRQREVKFGRELVSKRGKKEQRG